MEVTSAPLKAKHKNAPPFTVSPGSLRLYSPFSRTLAGLFFFHFSFAPAALLSIGAEIMRRCGNSWSTGSALPPGSPGTAVFEVVMIGGGGRTRTYDLRPRDSSAGPSKKKPRPSQYGQRFGGGGKTRTYDLRIMSPEPATDSKEDLSLSSADCGKARQDPVC
jgi:hypothetical protein